MTTDTPASDPHRLLDIGLKLCTDCGHINPPMEYDAHGPHCLFRHVLLVIQSESYLDGKNDQLRARLAASETRILAQQARIDGLEAALLLAQETRRTIETIAANLAAGETGWRQEVARLEAQLAERWSKLRALHELIDALPITASAYVGIASSWDVGMSALKEYITRLEGQLEQARQRADVLEQELDIQYTAAYDMIGKLERSHNRIWLSAQKPALYQQLPEQTAATPAYDARAWAKAWKRSARYWREVFYRMAGGNDDGDDWDGAGSLGAKAVVDGEGVVE